LVVSKALSNFNNFEEDEEEIQMMGEALENCISKTLYDE
jgi:hypothetical protein